MGAFLSLYIGMALPAASRRSSRRPTGQLRTSSLSALGFCMVGCLDLGFVSGRGHESQRRLAVAAEGSAASSSTSSSPQDNADIEELVYRRVQARYMGKWERADELRDQLRAKGVRLFDASNQWIAADGRKGNIPTFFELEASEWPVPGTANSGPSAGSTDEAEIRDLIRKREQARAGKRYAQSDRIRDELKEKGVWFHYKENRWDTKTGVQGCAIGGGETGEAGATDREIKTLLRARERARQALNFKLADQIRRELKEAGVEIFDKEKVWKAFDGRTGPVPSWAEINGWTDKKEGASKQSSGGPNSHQAELREALDYLNSLQDGGKPAELSDIEWLVRVRTTMRNNKDFTSSDTLRDAMRSSLGIEIHDKEKRWDASDGRSGWLPHW